MRKKRWTKKERTHTHYCSDNARERERVTWWLWFMLYAYAHEQQFQFSLIHLAGWGFVDTFLLLFVSSLTLIHENSDKQDIFRWKWSVSTATDKSLNFLNTLFLLAIFLFVESVCLSISKRIAKFSLPHKPTHIYILSHFLCLCLSNSVSVYLRFLKKLHF